MTTNAIKITEPDDSDVWSIHVMIPDRDPWQALCKKKSLAFSCPPKSVCLGTKRPDGSHVSLDDVELEAGYIAVAKRHPDDGTAGDLCHECMEAVERMRDSEKRRTERAKKSLFVHLPANRVGYALCGRPAVSDILESEKKKADCPTCLENQRRRHQ